MSFMKHACWRSDWSRAQVAARPPPRGYGVVRPSSHVGEYAISYVPMDGNGQLAHTKVEVKDNQFAFIDQDGCWHYYKSIFGVFHYLEITPWRRRGGHEDSDSDDDEYDKDSVLYTKRFVRSTKSDATTTTTTTTTTTATAAGAADGGGNSNTLDSEQLYAELMEEAYAAKKRQKEKIYAPPPLEIVRDRWEIDLSKLKLGEELGRGAFGRVNAAVYMGFFVAVKTLLAPTGRALTEKDIANFKKEAELMQHLEPHPNVLRLIGVNTKLERGPICIVTELCTLGPLTNLLKANRFTRTDKLRLHAQSAAGVRHLHLQHIIHRDLALRNLLMAEDRTLKVTDFGMSRSTIEDGGVTKNDTGPLRHFAPECLYDQRYSEKSDAWAWAVTVWEIETDGLKPYTEHNPAQAALLVCNEGLRLKKPPGTSNELFDLMYSCWATEEKDRPDFDMICNRLSGMLGSVTMF